MDGAHKSVVTEYVKAESGSGSTIIVFSIDTYSVHPPSLLTVNLISQHPGLLIVKFPGIVKSKLVLLIHPEFGFIILKPLSFGDFTYQLIV